ncbi:Siderophore-interacting protein OS=Tsukamurella paurometabola (strain ATCC 8368 / DSM / CCUG 35730 / CIP 100753 / JCM 10117 / KCTC 9821 / NBRC 16120 / NCIMB 702349 / NCTC 13040) OX=521096 GN=Tpau_3695 PE=4 SV=1 [Tsukamurella paurometabola]|uniref:Siderophore-interacting protein n=1 Tax=Tsukamurella paurometabola (strain ATCC 8368 / DSM 20162 / CCUG 35730 / CIP 100753 / JCM 10117 / KCTC 9821 / NBRC 16120 / NCIMB 702349 / NCTC 13040) TaxID=521096 RepID=D5UY36_TSUPD|nr:siderophore-interacting protein [Tsukamurella paurometabola]ADG80273.1 Siderophore-interacting protein [Tsukamurella paurometabola DSM 20162]SUP39095.1 Vibriobactin utilization protein ViuB [Tsukamurella paurometabola]
MKWNDFVLTVAETAQVSKSLLRLEFDVDPAAGQGYQPITPGDESIAFYLSTDGDELRTRRSDDPSALGGWEIVDTERSQGHRNYTVRHYDPAGRRMVVDIAEHDHGPAMDWFRAARPGWRLLAAGPRSWYSPPADAGRHVLAGDLAALPALARILEHTPPQIPVTVLAEVLDPSDTDYLPDRPNTEVIELLGSGNGAGPSGLAAALGRVELPTDAYLWLSGEAADTRAAKKHVRGLGWARGRADIVGYWRYNAEEWTQRFEASGGERLRQVFADALAAGKSREEATDLYERALEAAGL